MEFNRRSLMLGAALLPAVAALLNGRPAKADTPLVVPVLVGAGGALLANGISWGVGKLFGGDDDESGNGGEVPRQCITTVWTVADGQGNITYYPQIEYVNGSASSSVPPEPARPPGYIIEGTASIATDEDTVRFEIADSTRADVLDPEFDRTGRARYSLRHEILWRLRRPTGTSKDVSSVATAEIQIPELQIGTTDIPRTFGEARFDLSIGAVGVGSLFRASVTAVQGAPPVVDGDIPAEAFKIKDGSLYLRDFSKKVQRDVPPEVYDLLFRVTMEVTGFGIRTDGPYRR